MADEYMTHDASDRATLFYHDYYTPFPLEVPDRLTEDFHSRVRRRRTTRAHSVIRALSERVCRSARCSSPLQTSWRPP